MTEKTIEVNPGVGGAVAEVITSQMTGKKFYKSKTFWANVVLAGAVCAQSQWGFIIGPELQALIISAINLGLRKITKEEVVW